MSGERWSKPNEEANLRVYIRRELQNEQHQQVSVEGEQEQSQVPVVDDVQGRNLRLLKVSNHLIIIQVI